MSTALLLRGGRVVTMDRNRRVLDADVLVVAGRIKSVGPSGRGTGGGVNPAIIDCHGLVVLPGLVQTHIHLCQTLFRGLADDLSLEDWLAQRIWPLEAAHTEDSIYASAMLGAAELLLGGTTAILDMETVRHTGAAFEALEEIGIRATAGKCLMDAPSSPEGLRESTDSALSESAGLCARWHGAAGGRLRYCFAPRFVPSCTGPLLRAVSDLAEKVGAVVHTHAAETPVELEMVKRETGHDEIAYLDSVGISGPRTALAHCVWVDKDGIERLARQATNVVHCPSSNLKLGSGIAPIPEMLAAGCRVGIGADGAPCNNRLDAFAEMRLAALIQKPRLGPDALPAAQVLELATLGGARAMGLENEIGSIEVGKRADLVVLDLERPHTQPEDTDLMSRIVYSSMATDVRHVIVDGRVVVKDGELKTADLREIRQGANSQARRLRRSAGL
ncbi:MAG TPA: 5'-deoxyadenosine deaminase [Gemmatimonadales bacterium]|nr:5'-deoxyadenosine deaminase [Gemmatimonadales bacterium]